MLPDLSQIGFLIIIVQMETEYNYCYADKIFHL